MVGPDGKQRGDELTSLRSDAQPHMVGPVLALADQLAAVLPPEMLRGTDPEVLRRAVMTLWLRHQDRSNDRLCRGRLQV